MDIINSITVNNYRCFSGSQAVRLSPLTLLVGDNSTGKTALNVNRPPHGSDRTTTTSWHETKAPGRDRLLTMGA